METSRHPPLESTFPSHREQVRSDRRRSIVAFALSLVMNAFAGYEVHSIAEKARTEEQVKERDEAKDIIFLPVSEEELVEYLLIEAGVSSKEDIVQHPELAKKIDMGKFFLQTEFLEGKLDAKKAVAAYRNLEMKRNVFKKLAEEITDERIVIQEIMNEIADPQIALTDGGEKTKKDYQRGKTLLSTYSLEGKTNCLGATRAFEAIAGDVYPNMPVQLHEFSEHIRPIVIIGKDSYVAETGTLLTNVNRQDMSGTVLHKDARAAFLGILGLKSDKHYFPANTKNIDSTASIQWEQNEYENTRLANINSGSTDLSQPLRKFTLNEVPREADRKRMYFQEIPENDNQQLQSSAHGTTHEAALKATMRRLTLETKKSILDEIDKKKNEHKVKEAADDIHKAALNEAKTKEPRLEESVTKKEAEHMAKIRTLVDAQNNIPAFFRDSLAHPEKSADNQKEVSAWLTKLESVGMLDAFVKQEEDELKKIAPLISDKSHTMGHYLLAKIMVGEHIKKYKESKEAAQKELVPEKRKKIVDTLREHGYLIFSPQYTPEEKQKYPGLPDRYQISEHDIDDFITKDLAPVIKELKLKGKKVRVANLEGCDPKALPHILDFLEKNTPTQKLSIAGFFPHLEQLKKLMDKADTLNIEWHDPQKGQYVGPLSSMPKDRLVIFDLKEGGSIINANIKFSVIDETTQSIKDVHDPKDIAALGKEFVRQYIVRNSIFYSFTEKGINLSVHNVKGAIQEPLSNADMIDIGNTIEKHHRPYKGILSARVTNTSSLDWIRSWQKTGLAQKIEKWFFDSIPIDLHSVHDPSMNNISINKCQILGWGRKSIENRKIFIENSNFNTVPDENFFKKNEVRMKINKKEEMEKILAVLKNLHPEEISVEIKENELVITIDKTTITGPDSKILENDLEAIVEKLGVKKITITDVDTAHIDQFSVRDIRRKNIEIDISSSGGSFGVFYINDDTDMIERVIDR